MLHVFVVGVYSMQFIHIGFGLSTDFMHLLIVDTYCLNSFCVNTLAIFGALSFPLLRAGELWHSDQMHGDIIKLQSRRP